MRLCGAADLRYSEREENENEKEREENENEKKRGRAQQETNMRCQDKEILHRTSARSFSHSEI